MSHNTAILMLQSYLLEENVKYPALTQLSYMVSGGSLVLSNHDPQIETYNI